jgi:hypothetical protein
MVAEVVDKTARPVWSSGTTVLQVVARRATLPTPPIAAVAPPFMVGKVTPGVVRKLQGGALRVAEVGPEDRAAPGAISEVKRTVSGMIQTTKAGMAVSAACAILLDPTSTTEAAVAEPMSRVTVLFRLGD